MERVGQLLEALMDSHRKGADREELLRQVRVLQAELTGETVAAPFTRTLTSGKISVIMPYVPAEVEANMAPVEEERIVQVLQVDEQELEAELEEMRRSAVLKNEMSIKVRQAKVEWEDPMDEIPTLASHRDYLPKPPAPPVIKQDPRPAETTFSQEPATDNKQPTTDNRKPITDHAGRDLNEVIGTSSSSLNERLRTAQAELSERLKEAPLRDLRKAIGINDRYLYINELFNGNEVMFDRSLKTLNDFTAYSEAEFWIQRELRIKLAWKEDNAMVQQFLHLVRRRFS